jgi:hypothetical protein
MEERKYKMSKEREGDKRKRCEERRDSRVARQKPTAAQAATTVAALETSLLSAIH